MKSWYAICRNGGATQESIEGRFETRAEAWEIIEAEMEWADEMVEDGWMDDETQDRLDVVRVFEDGSITTEV